jgi:hypothetical protein
VRAGARMVCIVVSASTLVLSACSATDELDIDRDGDGFSPNDGDCDDDNPHIRPDAVEACDAVDNNCDGVVDEGYDADGDGWTTCAGDCRDNDPRTFPGAIEVLDGVDNDCDRLIDNHLPSYDDDGDGYSEDQGDCDDTPGYGALINPGAIEVATNADGEPEGYDNNCNGLIDEPTEPCPSAMGNPNRADNYALAIDVCHEVVFASWDEALMIDSRSHNIVGSFGSTYQPRAGDTMAILSTGLALDNSMPGWVTPQSGTRFANSRPHPDPGPPVTCNTGFGSQTYTDPATVNDYSEVKLVLTVPTNVRSFSFDFNFMSAEFPEFVCTMFDDTFIAHLESQAFTGNVSFDDNGNRVSINIGFFDVCAPSTGSGCTGNAELAGTGYETVGGGTGWLTTTAPVVPGEKITLTFMIWDEGDRIYDSLVLLDNFRWGIEHVEAPSTVERELLAGPITVRADRLGR